MTVADIVTEEDTVTVADTKTAVEGIINLATDQDLLGEMEARVKIASENLVSPHYLIHWLYLT
jgi:hypothetical protein